MPVVNEILPEERSGLRPLFAMHPESYIMEAVLEGWGSAWADHRTAPKTALLSYADIVLPGGVADNEVSRRLLRLIPVNKVILPAPGWEFLLQDELGPETIVVTRTRFSSRSLKRNYLKMLEQALPRHYRIKRINETLAREIYGRTDLISEDHIHPLGSPEEFVKRGIGFCVLDGDRIVSGASSYAVCSKGVEIQVNTHPEYQGQGLATGVCAALIGHVLDLGLDVKWDAGNEASIQLACRLGFTATGSYEARIRI
jgi:GNAT superfamily N-acetyltransferase